MSRLDILGEIERLDPERDCQRIVHLSFGYEFSWDSIRALELALFRTYCVPSISELLDRTGEFRRNPQRRYDDTAILLAEICKWGYDSERGRTALDRINWAHGHYRIANEDFLYVLSTFIYEPVRWIDAYAWRETCRNEKLGYYAFWRQVGQRMGIREIPASYELFAAWARDYERHHFRFDVANQRVGVATRELFVSWGPRFLAPLVRTSIHALLDEPMLRAFGFPPAPPFWRALVRFGLRFRSQLVRRLPTRKTPRFFVDRPNRTYPDGYRIACLGPPRLLDAKRPDPHSG